MTMTDYPAETLEEASIQWAFRPRVQIAQVAANAARVGRGIAIYTGIAAAVTLVILHPSVTVAQLVSASLLVVLVGLVVYGVLAVGLYLVPQHVYLSRGEVRVGPDGSQRVLQANQIKSASFDKRVRCLVIVAGDESVSIPVSSRVDERKLIAIVEQLLVTARASDSSEEN